VTAVWHFYWPVLVAAVIVGLVAGTAGYRKAGNIRRFSPHGAVAALAIALAWHGPGGAAKRLKTAVERSARVTLDNYEMPQVTARLEAGPLTRTLVLSGPADDFQQRELIRIIDLLPGVGAVRWDRPVARSKGL
jgi:hypothetical protein